MSPTELLEYRYIISSLLIGLLLILAYMATAKTKENKLTRQILLSVFLINIINLII